MSNVECRICHTIISNGRNKFYCVKCRETLYKQGAYRYLLGKNIYVWIRRNTIVRALEKGKKESKDISIVLQTREIIE